ncbi:MAG: phosphoribosyl-AMP cyclohydrolase [Candidatus Hydrogenedentota bacterium]|nr:MAG: phosphoribosyl-AMP cyclohydrolase [Candidatus Hydrogenedentota bacterium]
MKFLDELKFDNNGLVPAIVQESRTGEVLMLAYVNREALERTIRSGRTHFYSRSRKKLWCKGEVSGNVQSVAEVRTDCDCDTVLIKVRQKGAACHEGYKSCFYRKLENGSTWNTTGSPLFDPEEVYGGE